MRKSKPATAAPSADPDDVFPTDDEFERAEVVVDGVVVRRGRPPLEQPKRSVTVRLDAWIVEALRASGPGWQTRVNDVLGRSVKRQRRRPPAG